MRTWPERVSSGWQRGTCEGSRLSGESAPCAGAAAEPFLYDKTFGALVPPGESAGTRRLRATSFGAAWASSPTHLRATASRRERVSSPSALGGGTRRWGTRAEEGRKHLWVFPSKVGFSPVALGYARFGVLVSLDPGGPGKWPWRRGCDGPARWAGTRTRGRASGSAPAPVTSLCEEEERGPRAVPSPRARAARRWVDGALVSPSAAAASPAPAFARTPDPVLQLARAWGRRRRVGGLQHSLNA